MSLIPKNFINAIVAIGVQQNYNGYFEKRWIGSGFLVKMPEPGNCQLQTI